LNKRNGLKIYARCNVKHVSRDRVGGGRSWSMDSRS